MSIYLLRKGYKIMSKEKDTKVKKENEETYMSIGMSLGMCFGVAVGILVGVLIDNISICMCFGVSIGMCIGMGVGSLIKKDNNKNK